MAVFLQNDVVVSVNSVDLSDHVASITWTETADELETTAMGDGNRTRIGGLKDGSVSIEFHQDFAASETYITLYSLLGTKTGDLPGWNFGKYLVGKDGAPIQFYGPSTGPDDDDLRKAIEAALGA